MPYLTDLSPICGDILEPVFCLVGCFLLIALGLWAMMSTGRKQRSRSVMFGVAVVAVAFPIVVFSSAWITCGLGDYGGSSSAGAASLPQPSVKPRFARN